MLVGSCCASQAMDGLDPAEALAMEDTCSEVLLAQVLVGLDLKLARA